jgi:2-(3-amino-3-carboxypropyl)histidine synthase
MKTIFIPAKFKSKVNKSKILEISGKLPKNLAIAYSIQFKDIANEIKAILTENNHKVTGFTQVLGCSKPDFSKDTQAVLLISTGKFHAISLAYESKLPIYILDKNKLERISESDIELIAKKHKASYMRFLNADSIGVIVSTKPGQNRLKKAMNLDSSKKQYTFLTNAINIREFENFPDIGSWINTACPRMDMDNSAIINIDKITKE